MVGSCALTLAPFATANWVEEAVEVGCVGVRRFGRVGGEASLTGTSAQHTVPFAPRHLSILQVNLCGEHTTLACWDQAERSNDGDTLPDHGEAAPSVQLR